MTEDSKRYLRNYRVLKQLLILVNANFQKKNSSLPDVFLTKMKNVQLGEDRFHPHHRSFPKCE